jgi:hypothetical protein
LLLQLTGDNLSCIKDLLLLKVEIVFISEVDGGRVDVARSFLSKPLRDTFRVSRVRLSSMPEKNSSRVRKFSARKLRS